MQVTNLLRFLFGGGWWTLWYGFFYLIVLTGNLMWFGELAAWARKGESGPAGGAVFMGLVSLGGLPLLAFSLFHVVLASFRGADSRGFMLLFALVLVGLLLFWMIAGASSIAEAVFSGFVSYYVALAAFIFINLGLLWVTRQESSLRSLLPFFP